jgi:hypothetical protein
MAGRLAAYNAIKQQAEKAQRAADRAAGALDAAMLQLKTEFGCDSIEAAESLLIDLKAEAADAAKAADNALDNFEQEWGDALRQLPNAD